MIKNAKKEYVQRLGVTLESGQGNNKNFWCLAKSVLGKSADCCIPPLKCDNGLFSSNRDKVELFNEYFVNKCKLDDESSIRIPSILTYRTDSRLASINILTSEVQDILLSLDTDKAIGPDHISPFLLKHGATELAPSLARLFNYSLSSCQIPNIWKTANVVPVFKKGDKQDISNYRPVSLLSVVNKCFEKIIFKYVFNFFTDNSIVTKWQSGFIPGDSTIKQLVNIQHLFAEAVDNKKDVRVVFCDISAAFDRVWHCGLLYKLECAGITGSLINWFRSYLSDRTQQVVIQGQTSTRQIIQAGVPQGSVLGPLLFLIFINDLPDIVNSHIRLFADDTTLYVIVDATQDSATMLNTDLQAINIWAKKWQVKFNPSKTETLFITTKPNPPVPPPLYFDGQVVDEVKSHKHLGVLLSSDLSWNAHIDAACLKATRRLDIMRSFKYLLSRRALEQIYFVFIRPIIEYGDVLYDGCGLMNEAKLNKVQYEAAKIVSGAMHGTSYDLLLKDLGWEPLKSRRERHKLCLFYDFINGNCPLHMLALLPDNITHNYQIRDPQIPSILARTNKYYNSFIPSSIRLWNSLDIAVKQSDTLASFKAKLCQQTKPKKISYYCHGPRSLNVALTRLRVNCAPLNSYLHKIGVLDSSACECGFSNETVLHYICYCPLYATEREELILALSGLTIFTLDNVLCGSNECSEGENYAIIDAVQLFIKQTKRFIQT